MHKQNEEEEQAMNELKLKCQKKRNHVCSQGKRTCTPHYQNYFFLKSLLYRLHTKS